MKQQIETQRLEVIGSGSLYKWISGDISILPKLGYWIFNSLETPFYLSNTFLFLSFLLLTSVVFSFKSTVPIVGDNNNKNV